jgi:hypothetical protein
VTGQLSKKDCLFTTASNYCTIPHEVQNEPTTSPPQNMQRPSSMLVMDFMSGGLDPTMS